MKKTLAAITVASLLSVSPSPCPDGQWVPNTWEPTTTEANDTAHSIKVWEGPEYDYINGIATEWNDAIAINRDTTSSLANPKREEKIKETLTEEPWNTTKRWASRYGVTINPNEDQLSTEDEESNLPPAEYDVDEKHGIWRIAGKSIAKKSYTLFQVDKAVKICIKKGADTIDLNYYNMSEKLMKDLEAKGITFYNKYQNQ